MKDPGTGAVVHIEFLTEEKANAFRDAVRKDGVLIEWDYYDVAANSMVRLAEDDE